MYNIYTTLGRRCIIVVQMFCVYWVITAIHIVPYNNAATVEQDYGLQQLGIQFYQNYFCSWLNLGHETKPPRKDRYRYVHA